jgi:hypothetical protein
MVEIFEKLIVYLPGLRAGGALREIPAFRPDLDPGRPGFFNAG